MNFLIADALAAPADPTGGSPWSGLIMMLVLFAVFYFFLIRPQSKRQKEHREMVGALATGDEVITQGGILGRINAVGEQFVTVEVADGMELKIQRHSVAALVPKGTVKSA